MAIRRGLVGLMAMLVAATVGAACSSSDADPVAECEAEPIDVFKELLIVDEDVVSDPRSRNATNGPWSFRYAIENLAPEGVDPGVFVHRWLTAWVTPKELNGFRLDTPQEERVLGMNNFVLCPWKKQTPENNCNADCSVCTGDKLDLSLAPFRLIGLTNRMDARGRFAGVPNGEGRLVFALTDGPADLPESAPLSMAIIFEYALPESKSLQEWARAWHALGKFSERDESYRVALEAITNSFVKRGSRPSAINGSAIAQIRTNENQLNWIWQLRQFELGSDGFLSLVPVFNTPAEQLNNSALLRDYVVENADAIRADTHILPISMRSGSADALRFTWVVPDVEPDLARAFAASTCNGCHSEQQVVDTAFHFSPFRKGREKVSRHLYDPAGGGKDEISGRTKGLRRALCRAD